MNDETHDSGADDAVERIAAMLRPLPDVDPAAKARVLVAVASERARGGAAARRRHARGRLALLGTLAAGLVATAVIVWRVSRMDGAPASTAAAPASGRGSSAKTSLASNDAELTTVTVQLVLRAPDARRVAVVGDFTGWDDHRIPMVRDPASGLWSATVAVRPGRHVYAFVADDSAWMRDPRAPVVTDPDFGRPGSLLLVARP